MLLPKGAKHELSQREMSLKQAKGNKNITSLTPVVIITADKGMNMCSKEIQDQWMRSHELVANSILNCTHIVAKNSKHHIQAEQPKIIIEMLKKLLSSTMVSKTP